MVRTSTDRIAELEQKIAGIKSRDERRAARQKPETKHLIGALRGIDGALASENATLRVPLNDARTAVATCLGILGAPPKTSKLRATVAPTKGRRRAGKRDTDQV